MKDEYAFNKYLTAGRASEPFEPVMRTVPVMAPVRNRQLKKIFRAENALQNGLQKPHLLLLSTHDAWLLTGVYARSHALAPVIHVEFIKMHTDFCKTDCGFLY